jgi:membrane protease YdiL (CAAX protease family)
MVMMQLPVLSWRESPVLVRAAPFLIFVGLTSLQGAFGEASRYWMYGAKTLAGVGLIWLMRPVVQEMRWRFSWDAVVVGVTVFLLWVGLDQFYLPLDALIKKTLCPVLKEVGLKRWCETPPVPTAPWNPFLQFSSPLAWGFALTRLIGSTLVVPPLEETFYRSFVYRYIIHPDFVKVPMNRYTATALFMTALIFGCAHYEWLPGILCGLLYQGLVLRHNRLGEAMSAHAITNALLALWILWKGAWHFW